MTNGNWRKVVTWLASAALLAVLACDSSSQKDTGDEDESGKEAGDDEPKEGKKTKKGGDEKKMSVEVKLGGEDVKLAHAIVADRGTSALWVHLSTDELDCEKMNTGVPDAGKDGAGVAVQLAPQLQPDGKVKWVVKSASYKKGKDWERKVDTKAAKVGKVEGEATKEVTADVDFAIEGKEGKKMTVKGTVVAKGCGSKPQSSRKMDPRPQKDLKATISGHSFDIAGALLKTEKDGDTVLTLTTAPQSCDGYASAGDFGIDLKLDEAKKQVVHAWFRGDMMASNYNTSHDPVGSVEIGAGGDEVAIEVDYERKAFDFDVKVKGKVEALVCEAKK